jgi:hypothetical protein
MTKKTMDQNYAATADQHEDRNMLPGEILLWKSDLD